MYSKSDNIEIMIYDKADEVIQKRFESLFSRSQTELETTVRGKSFIFYCVSLLHYKCNKTNLKRCGSYIDFSDWSK